MLKHYIGIIYPGAFLSETSMKEISVRGPKLVSFPNSAYGFYYLNNNWLNN